MLVFPSFLETFGHPMLEAMLAGTPIVASEIPAFQEIGEDVALFFPSNDSLALARAIAIAWSPGRRASVNRGTRSERP